MQIYRRFWRPHFCIVFQILNKLLFRKVASKAMVQEFYKTKMKVLCQKPMSLLVCLNNLTESFGTEQ